MSHPRTTSFDGWVLRIDLGELAKDGRKIHLQDQPLQILDELLSRPGELVTREQLIARLWPTGVVDFDTGLNSAVRKLRVALQDEAETPRYIETLPRKGYRFIGDVPPIAPPAFNPPAHSIAVLPFMDMSGDPEQEYFSDGIAEELLNSLVRISELKVAARTSAFAFKGKHMEVGEIARRLNVGAILDGSVRKAGDRLRITGPEEWPFLAQAESRTKPAQLQCFGLPCSSTTSDLVPGGSTCSDFINSMIELRPYSLSCSNARRSAFASP